MPPPPYLSLNYPTARFASVPCLLVNDELRTQLLLCLFVMEIKVSTDCIAFLLMKIMLFLMKIMLFLVDELSTYM
jgi:hypothetical protein